MSSSGLEWLVVAVVGAAFGFGFGWYLAVTSSSQHVPPLRKPDEPLTHLCQFVGLHPCGCVLERVHPKELHQCPHGFQWADEEPDESAVHA